VSHRLQAAGLDHVLVDTDELDRIYPVPADPSVITRDNLAAMWRTFAARGSRRVILVGVFLDRPEELDWVRVAIPDARFTCVRLLASDASLAERVHRRELGSDREGQLERTRRQAAAMDADVRDGITRISTDGRDLGEIAAEILTLWPTPA
jgi:hypothetical protein